MKSNWLICFTLALPLALFAACNDDDDATTDNGGAGGATAGHSGTSGSGGRAGSGGHAGRAADTAAGAAGEDTTGTAGTSGSGTGGTTGGGSAGVAGDVGDEGGASGAAAALSDAQILKVLSTANEGEISVAQVAKPALQNSEAVSFAQMMIDEHSAANSQTLALVSTKHIAPMDSDASASLEDDTATVIITLSATPPAAFDKTYIDSQVTMHQRVLSLIDTRLVPDASDADVKTLLGTIRTSVAAHLTHAQTISAALP